MSDLTTMKAFVVKDNIPKNHVTTVRLALLNEDGTPVNLDGFTPAEAQADSEATTIAGLVTDFNSLLAKLRDAGIMLS